MSKPKHQPGIENEPHLKGQGYEGDPTEQLSDELLRKERFQATEADHVEHTVWNEPALSPQLAGEPDEYQLTYQRWLKKNIESTSWEKSWWITLLVVLAAGPWGVIGAFMGTGSSISVLIMVVVIGPVTEEITKIATALWIVEKRPYLFKSMSQIALCAISGGAAFAAIENLVYTYVYVAKPTYEFIAFRWTVCVGLHVTCSFVAGIGLIRIWDNAIRNMHRPILALGVPWFVIAMFGHGLYNLTATIAQAAGWLDFGMTPPSE